MRSAGLRSRVNRRTLLAVCFLLCTTPSVPAERLPIRFYTAADGLAHDTVYKIVQDTRGFLWFCTFEGLSQFDGYRFITYGLAQGLPSQVVRDLLVTRDGEYWVATTGGLCRFNHGGAPRRAATHSTQLNGTPPAMFEVYAPGQDRGSNTVTSLLQDRTGTIWCGTFGGLYRLDRRRGEVAFQRLPPLSAVTSMIEDRHGTLWIGSTGGRIYRRWPDGRVDEYSGRDRSPGDQIQSLLEDAAGRVWAGSRFGLWRLTQREDLSVAADARVYASADGLPADSINGLFQSSDGSLWAGSNRGLISVIQTTDGKNVRFRLYAKPQVDDFVHSITQDGSGNIWLGTTSGAAKFARNGITAFTDTDGLRGTSAMFQDRAGDLFVLGGRLSKNLINRYDGERFIAIPPQWPDGSERLWRENQGLLQDSRGEWWVATTHGLYRFPAVGSFERVVRTRPTATYTSRDGLASDNILRLFEDSRHDIWVAAAGGLSRWNRASESFHHYQERDGWGWRFSPESFAEDQGGGVWIGLAIGGGLVRYRDGRFTRFTEADGLGGGGILQLLVDSSGRLWVPMSPGGVFRIDHPEAERPNIVPYSTAQGLAGNDVEGLAEDRRGRIYLASVRGIDRLDPATGHIRHYSANEGTLRAGVNGALRYRDDTLWFRYETGVVRFDPESDAPLIPPPVVITGLRIAGTALPISALGQTEVAATELPAARNQLEIDFVALGLSAGDGSRYEYKLDGASSDWIVLGERRTVNFAHLAPGRYRFLVRAISADGAASETPASFVFTITPPLWQRWWFISAAGFGLLLGGYTFQRHRLTRLLELERVRTRIAADLHDDIGSSLSQISILSEVLRTQLGSQEAPVSANLSLINRVSREALDSMSDIVWAINPRQDHLIDLVRRMRRAASQMLQVRGIEFTFTTPPTGHDLKLGADTRRQVFLMFKETLTNIVRHSRGTRAEITLKLDGRWIALVVADDGQGFDPDQATDGNGLVSLRRRARSLGGEAMVKSQTGAGTTLTITIPHGHGRGFGTRQHRSVGS